MILASLIFATIAALLHVYIFTMESITWTQPKTWKTFSITSQADAETTKPLAYNQGFYNLFLAVGALIGIVAVAMGAPQVGWTLVFSSCGSMLLAALVLAASGKKYLRAATLQGATPLLAVVLGVLAVTLG
ncbi:UNVERIFIED_CONTAM: putative membrane protein [Jeotgalibacillus campisalis]